MKNFSIKEQFPLLLAEDDPLLSLSIKDFLETKGYRVYDADNCAYAIEILNHYTINVALVDKKLPDGEGQIIVNKHDLKEEKSRGFTLGIDFGKQKKNKLYQFSISGFYNRLYDVFTLRKIDPIESAQVFERFNSKGAKVYGIEIEAGFKIAGKFEVFSGWTFQKSEYDEPEPDFNSRKMFRTPDIYGNLRIEWNISKFIDVLSELIYTGSMKIPHFAGYIKEDTLEHSDPFVVINLSLNKKISLIKGEDIIITASILNILDNFQKDLDKGVYRDAGYTYGPRVPRTFRIGIRYAF